MDERDSPSSASDLSADDLPSHPLVGTWKDDLDRWLAWPMWVVALVFLALLACEIRYGAVRFEISVFGWGMLLLWPLLGVELAIHLLSRSNHCRYNVVYCVFPPLRLGARDHATWTRIWLPWLGWRTVGRKLRQRMQKSFGVPMIVIALAVLPLLALDFSLEWYQKQAPRTAGQVADSGNQWLTRTVEIGTSVIWFAFAFELIVMLSVVRNKLRYCVEHWVDIVVVVLPMVAFLRIVWLVRLGYVGRMLRMYRLRGMAIRAYRAVLMLDIMRRVLHINPEKRMRALRERLDEYYYQIEETRREMRELEAKIAERKPRKEALLADSADTTSLPETSAEG